MCSAFYVVLSFGFLVLVRSYYVVDKTKVLEDTALEGYAFRNLTLNSVNECFLSCFEDCFCMAFQLCSVGAVECQLLSSSQFQTPSAMVTTKGCSYYDMFPDIKQVRGMIASRCIPASLPCQFHRNLCQNNGTYVALAPTDHTGPRYKCLCQEQYAGSFCEYSRSRFQIKSCRGHINGSQSPGYYTVYRNNPFKVFCDFDRETGTAWTLVQSYELQKRKSVQRTTTLYFSKHQSFPRWDLYRLSKYRMRSIRKNSTKWRITCNYDKVGVVRRDYLEARIDKIDFLGFLFDYETRPKACFTVEYINVRGHNCSRCTVPLYQERTSYPLHVDTESNKACDFQPTGGVVCDGQGEDNFGYYACINPNHRCSSSKNATTQIWYGD